MSVVELNCLNMSITLQLTRVRMGSDSGSVQLTGCAWHTPCPASALELANTVELTV
jgi:hypothetical protein